MTNRNGDAHPTPVNRLPSLPCEQEDDLETREQEDDLETRKQRAVKALHEQFDQLNARWAEKEKELVEMNVPVSVWHQYKSLGPDLDGNGETYSIGLTRWCGKRRLVWSCFEWHHPDETEETKPIVEASLEDRIDAAACFHQLREKVIEAAEHSVAKVQQAIKALSR